MNNIMGKPHALKQVNLSTVRKAIKEKGSATRAEIVNATNISVTTVRTLLTEMLENNEIIPAGQDESIGGRKAIRYQLKKDRFFGVGLCLTSENIRYITVDICGDIHESGSLPAQGDISEAVISLLDELFTKLEIKSIGIGVPGIVEGLKYRTKNAEGLLEVHSVGELINERYGVPVILENDLNAIALGFGRCYLKQYPNETCESINMAYIHFDKHCLSAGFLSAGRILRGWNNFVGELGLYPVDDTRTMDDLLGSPLEDEQYARIVAKMLAGICCVLNPQYIALGGSHFRKDCLGLITECFDSTLPDKMSAEILYAEDVWHDYLGGMAYLTADQIFSNVLLVKEQR